MLMLPREEGVVKLSAAMAEICHTLPAMPAMKRLQLIHHAIIEVQQKFCQHHQEQKGGKCTNSFFVLQTGCMTCCAPLQHMWFDWEGEGLYTEVY